MQRLINHFNKTKQIYSQTNCHSVQMFENPIIVLYIVMQLILHFSKL